MALSYLHSHWPYYMSSALALLTIYLAEQWQNYFFSLFLIYSVLPIADQILPHDDNNPTPKEVEMLSKQFKWKIPIYSYIISQWVVLFWALSYVQNHTFTYFELLGFLLTVGHITAIGFLYSHELFHKRSWIEKSVGTLSMMNSLYMHFYNEHLYGHHKNLATPNDPATAKYGQNVYNFLVSSWIGGVKGAWNIEANFLARKGKSRWHWQNRIIWCFVCELAFIGLIGLFFGNKGMALFLGQAGIGILLLEAINYIRHYGLVRREIKSGVYEKVNIHHSWNAPHYLQNIFLLKLQRHSDHHENSYKEYQTLCSYKESPCLPGGYAVCIPLCLFPKLWYLIINPLVMETNQLGKPSEKKIDTANKLMYAFIAVQASLFAIANIIQR